MLDAVLDRERVVAEPGKVADGTVISQDGSSSAELPVRIQWGGTARQPEQPISAGELVVKLYETWGTRWVVDRLISLTRGAENDWLEFKATLCPPPKHIERYAGDRDNRPKYVKGDYYLDVVKAVVSLMNGHGGAVLLGVVQGRGKSPSPADSDRLCESPEHAPVLIDELCPPWDTDKWLLYVRNVLKGNEWIDRYGTTWNCSEILDDPFIRLFNGVLNRQPVIVIAVFPATEHPVELRRSVPVGRQPHALAKGTRPQLPEYCARRAKHGGNCHWPHDDPEYIRPSVIPLRVRGDTASVNLKWSFTEVARHWQLRTPEEVRFARFANEESQSFENLPYGITAAVDSAVARSYDRAIQLKSDIGPSVPHEYQVQSPNGSIRPLKSVLDHPYFPRGMTCLTGADARARSTAAALLCIEGIQRHTWGASIPILVRLGGEMDGAMLRCLREAPERFIIANLLPRLGGPACSRAHWEYLAEMGCVHVVLDDFDDIPTEFHAAFLRSILGFRQEYTHSSVTMVSGLSGTQCLSQDFVCCELVIHVPVPAMVPGFMAGPEPSLEEATHDSNIRD